MAATTKTRIPGILTLMSCSTTATGTFAPILAFDNFTCDFEINDADATAANSLFMQYVVTQKMGSATISGFLGAEFPQTFNPGDEFYVKFTEGANDVSMALKGAQAIPGKCRLKKISDSANKDPAKTQFQIKWGYVD